MTLPDPPPIVEELANATASSQVPVFTAATARSVGHYLKALHAAVVAAQEDIEFLKETN